MGLCPALEVFQAAGLQDALHVKIPSGCSSLHAASGLPLLQALLRPHLQVDGFTFKLKVIKRKRNTDLHSDHTKVASLQVKKASEAFRIPCSASSLFLGVHGTFADVEA